MTMKKLLGISLAMIMVLGLGTMFLLSDNIYSENIQSHPGGPQTLVESISPFNYFEISSDINTDYLIPRVEFESVQVGNVGEPIVIEFSLAKWLPNSDRITTTYVSTPLSFQVDESDPNITVGNEFSIWGDTYYGVTFSSDIIDENFIGKITFIPTEEGAFAMMVNLSRINFLIYDLDERWDEYQEKYYKLVPRWSVSQFEYLDPTEMMALELHYDSITTSVTLSQLIDDDGLVIMHVKMTDAEVKEYFQKLSVKYGTEITMQNIVNYDLEYEGYDNISVSHSTEWKDGEQKDIFYFFVDKRVSPYGDSNE